MGRHGTGGAIVLWNVMLLAWLVRPAVGQPIVVDTLLDVADPPFDSNVFCGIGGLPDLPGADGHVSLREALIAANNTTGPNTITFAPGLAGGRIMISFDSTDPDALPDLLPPLCPGGVTIDGDINGDEVPDVTIDGTALGEDGAGIGMLSSDNRVHGLELENFSGIGIYLRHASNVDRQDQHDGNTIVGNHIRGGSVGILTVAGIPGVNFPGRIVNTRIANNVVTEMTDFGIAVASSEVGGSEITDTVIEGNRVENGAGFGIAVTGQGAAPGAAILNLRILSNTVTQNASSGIVVGAVGGTGHRLTGVEIIDNIVEDNDEAGIGITGFCGARSMNIAALVERNSVRRNGTNGPSGIGISGGDDTDCTDSAPAMGNRIALTVRNNVVIDNRRDGIAIGGAAGDALDNHVDASVSGNTVLRSGGTGIVLAGGVRDAESKLQRRETRGAAPSGTLRNSVAAMIDGNMVCDNVAADIVCAGGIEMGGAVDESLLNANEVTGRIHDNSAGVIDSAERAPGNICRATVEANRPCTCAGDCGNDGAVTVDELLTMVNVALGTQPLSSCQAGDANSDGTIAIDDILRAVSTALSACSGGGTQVAAFSRAGSQQRPGRERP